MTLIARLAAIALMLFAAQARADDCPSTIYYTNGNYLKYGDTFYYPNGDYLKYGSTLYHANGNYLKYGSTFFYENGNYLSYGSTLYYPNGNYLKYGSTLYYQNGNYFQYGSTFYHPNGNYARYGTTLYRPNGTPTPFPISLREEIASYGTITARVESDYEEVHIQFNRLGVDTRQVRSSGYWDGTTFREFRFRLGTGAPNETVVLDVSDTRVDCYLQG